ncbi:unnamed protein product [marine sediment metagenome]|uniref:C1q domain-containing protein n=1 Tax=marine sediment metagenome TaxID=412755 RepID=X1RPD4_9ZZZZ
MIYKNGVLVSVATAVGVGARVYNDSPFTVANNVYDTVEFNTESWDTDNCHDNVTNNDRLTCRTAGKYLLIAQIRWVGNATGYREMSIRVANGASTPRAYTQKSDLNANNCAQNLATIVDMAVNEYARVYVKQTSGGNLDIEGGKRYAPDFMMMKIG